jgi:hypothetical protein
MRHGIAKIALVLALLSNPAWAQVSYTFTGGSLPAGITFTRGSSGTYTNSSGNLATASTNVARFNYISGTPYLLIEPAATNILQYSNAFSSGNWFGENSSVITAAQFTSPDGTNDGWSATGGTSYGGPQNAVTTTAQAYTQSVWAKYITTGATFCFSGGSQTTLASTVARFSYTHTFAAGSQTIILQSCDGTSKTVGYFGAQVEAGSVATSYIVNTTAGTASRSADAAVFTIPYGVYSLTYTFDDNSTQVVSVSPGSYTIPTNLNRPNLKSIAGAVTQVYQPTFSIVPTTYAPGLTVTLADSTGGATICYRLDGIVPTATVPGTCDSPALTYSAPLTVNATTQLETIGTKSGLTNSSASAGTYTIVAGNNYANPDTTLTLGGAQTATATGGTTTNKIVTATSGGADLWQLLPNPWGAGSSYTGSVTVAYPGTGSITSTINMGSLPAATVSGYPLVFWGGDEYGDQIGTGPVKLPYRLSQMGSLVTDVAYTLTNTTAPASQDVGFDDWLIPTNPFSGGQSGAVEVFIALDYSGFSPPGTLVGTYSPTILLNGVPTALTFNEYIDGSGAGSFVLFVPSTNTTSGEFQLDKLGFYDKAATGTGVGTNWYIAGFDYGTEFGGSTTVNYSLANTKIGLQQTILAGGINPFWFSIP